MSKREEISQRYSSQKQDSIVYRDSIWYRVKGDTVYVSQVRYTDRWKVDTLRQMDTIRVEREKEIKNEKIERKTDWKKTIVAAIVLSMLPIVVRIVKRIRK
ncbi:MAG: hypothetical protein MJZ71_05535 [Bacteroidales bacterium]|nr:hypothetical protein [Bacteroidales bacterium]